MKRLTYKTFAEARAAAVALEITGFSDYVKRYKEDPHLPSNPNNRYKNSGWINWTDFLGIVGYYETYKEARTAATALRVTSYVAYQERYKEDPRLVSAPWSKYKNSGWVGWGDFLGSRKKYATFVEAKFSSQKIGFKSTIDYTERYKKDPLLPGTPHKTYGDSGWVDWYDYLGNSYSLKNLVEKIKKKKITTQLEYDELAKTSDGFPKDPVTFYGFQTFTEIPIFKLWGFEKTISYIQENRISNGTEYAVHASKNPHLNPNPIKIEGFVSRLHYYKRKFYDDVFDKNENYISYINVAEKYLKTKGNTRRIGVLIKRYLLDYMILNNAPEVPQLFLLESNKTPSLDEFISTLSASHKSNKPVEIIREYIDALLLAYCADVDEDTGQIVYIKGYHNPFLTHDVIEAEKEPKLVETVKAILPDHYMRKGREFLCPHEAKEFSDLENSIRITAADFFEVDKSLIDKTDKNCVWRKSEVAVGNSKRKRVIYQMWSPVRAMALFTLFSLPLRGQQILWNDSGEADAQVPNIDGENIVWRKNNHDLSGQFTTPQGFIKKYSEKGKDELGFHATTNKTKIGEGGYSVPYMPHELVYWLIKLRQWQAQYNPIKSPAQWTNIHKLARQYSKKRLAERGFNGKQCFLFRDPSARHESLRQLPVSTNVIISGLPILLSEIQDDELPLVTRVEGVNPSAMSAYTSEYTPHSLRASLITALITDYGVAVPIVAKLVGHASIVMTIYYTVYQQGRIRKALEEAQHRALANKGESIALGIMEKKFKDISSQFVDNVSGELIDSLNRNIRKASVLTFDYGLCPTGGGQCHEGGDRLSHKGLYAPVSPGYLGRQNCLRCRFFVTGAPFLGGLKMLADEISLEVNNASSRMDEAQTRLVELEDEFEESCEMTTVFKKKGELNRARSLYQSFATKFDELAIDLIHIYRLADSSVKLLNNREATENKNLPMVVNKENMLEIMPDEVSAFRSLDTICKNTELYASADPSRAIPRRSQILDTLGSVNNCHFGLFKLTPIQQLEVGNQITRLLLERLGSWNKLDCVAQGQNFLVDFIEAKELTKLNLDLELLSNEPSQGLKLNDRREND
jgi:hypothetical protein